MKPMFPMTIYTKAITASESIEVFMKNDRLTTHHRLNLTLRADFDTKIELESGQGIHEVDINITLMTEFKTGIELDEDLIQDEIGYLCQNLTNGKIWIVGAAIIPLENMPRGLSTSKNKCFVSLTIANLETITEHSKSIKWGIERPNVLHIKGMQLSIVPDQNS